MRIWIVFLFLCASCYTAAAQKKWVSSVDYEQELAFYRPRITLGEHGTYAVAWETYRKLPDDEEWQIALQRFGPAGEALGPVEYLRDEGYCERGANQQTSGFQNVDLSLGSEDMLYLSVEAMIDTYETMVVPAYSNSTRAFYVEDLDFAGAHRMLCPSGASDRESARYEHMRFDIVGMNGQGLMLLPPLALKGASDRFDNAHYMSTSRGLASPVDDGVVDNWYDVVTNGERAVVAWQRCLTADEEVGDSDACSVQVTHYRVNRHRAEYIDYWAEMNSDQPVADRRAATSAFRYRPATAMNGRGESVVVWVDYGHSEYGEIYAQRYNASGSVSGSSIRVSGSTRGKIEDLESIGPEVAMLEDGRFLVVWTEREEGKMRALGRHFDPDGRSAEGAFYLDADTEAGTAFPDVSSNGSAYAYTWLSMGEDGASIFTHVSTQDPAEDTGAPQPHGGLTLNGYPNPFSKGTTLEYVLPGEGHVKLAIYDLLGREVKKLIDKRQGPGAYRVDVPADELATGYYITKLQQGGHHFSKVLVRTE